METMGKGIAYTDIDNIPEDLIKVEYDIDKKTGETKGYKKPAKKKWVVEMDGKQFEVASKVQKTLTSLWKDNYEPYEDDEDEEEAYPSEYYDPSTLLDLCGKYNIPAEGYIHDGTGIRINNPTSALFMTSAGFIGTKPIDIDSLDQNIVDKRIRVFVHVLMRCCEEDVAKELVARATKKKNGTLHKGRLLTIAHLDLTDEDGYIYVVVAKNDSDSKISIEVRETELNSGWYYESDLFKSVPLFFGNKVVGNQITADLYKGLGEGRQVIDESEVRDGSDYAIGIDKKYLSRANELLEKILKWRINPNEYDWEDKLVTISPGSLGRINEAFIKSIMEAGAIPMLYRGRRKQETVQIASLDYSIWKSRHKLDARSYIDAELLTLADYILEEKNKAGKPTFIVTEEEFLKWCVNGHSTKYDIDKKEHLLRYKSDKIKFDKIESKDIQFILNRIGDQISRGKVDDKIEYLKNPKVLCCIVGSGTNAVAIRDLLEMVGLKPATEYVETAEWEYLILDDIDSEETIQSYHIAEFNRECGIKLKVFEASEFIARIDKHKDYLIEQSKYVKKPKRKK